jgi:hypothetical protein
MKILHLIYDHIKNPWVAGGGAFRVYEIYRRFPEKYEITVVCGRYPGAADYREDNIDYEFVGTDRNNYVLGTFCYAVKATAVTTILWWRISLPTTLSFLFCGTRMLWSSCTSRKA